MTVVQVIFLKSKDYGSHFIRDEVTVEVTPTHMVKSNCIKLCYGCYLMHLICETVMCAGLGTRPFQQTIRWVRAHIQYLEGNMGFQAK